MFYAGLIGNELVGPWKVPEGVKLTSVVYVAFLKEHLEPWFKFKPLSLQRKTIFMHDNGPSHAAKTTRELPREYRFNKWSCQGVASIFARFEPHQKPAEHH